MEDAASVSFYQKNQGAIGDVVAISCKDKELAGIISALGNYGSKEKYVHEYKGINIRNYCLVNTIE